MIGAIAGDMIGSPYEGDPVKTRDFPLRVSAFTDDTVLTVAVAHAVLSGEDMAETLKSLCPALPQCRLRRYLHSMDPDGGKPAVQQLRQRLGHAGLSRRVRL